LRILVTVLTGIGMIGVGVDFLAFFAILGPLTGGCAMAGVAAILMGLIVLVVLGYFGLIAGLAIPGLILCWRQSKWGPRLLIPANLLSMAFFYWSPVRPGQVAWASVLVLLAIAPAVATVLLFWALVTRGPGPVGIADALVLGLMALPLASGYAYGVGADVSAALTPAAAPQAVVHVDVGCGGSASLLTGVLKVIAP